MGVMCGKFCLQLNKGVNMNDRLNQVLAISDLKLEQGLARLSSDYKNLDRLERVLRFSDTLGLAREGWIPATKQTRLIGSRNSQILR
jgi:hypothetical protein